MEFNEKLQELRKKQGLTQEELAEKLYVSRTAVSKWESGRGYPGIDSLKAISGFFAVSIDELLSGEELLVAAEEDSRNKENRLRDILFGLLDVGTVTFFFLPFFGQKGEESISSATLLSFTGAGNYIKTLYLIITFVIIIFGILTLALQNSGNLFWKNNKSKISVMLSAAAVFLFVISRQPYAGAFLFVFLVIKALMIIKWR